MILLILLLSIISICVYHFYFKRRSLPPGPFPLPILGNALALKKYEPGYEAYKKWSKEYGPVYTMWLGPQPMVIVTDYQIMKETFLKDGMKYAGRAPNPMDREVRHGDYGVLLTSDALWSQQRRFAIQVLRDFGVGKNLMEERVLSEVHHLITKMKREAKKGPADLQDDIDAAIGSVINTLLFGYRYDESRMTEFLHLKTQLGKQMAAFAEPAMIVVMMYPWLGKLPYFCQFRKILTETTGDLHAFFRKQIENHRKEIDMNSEQSSDYCEAYLKEQKKKENELEFGGFSEIQLVNMCYDLWVAGMETTSNTIYWGILYVLRAPDILEKIHAELDKVIGGDRTIVSIDRSNLHYTNAVIHEVQRLANLIPHNVPHRTTDDVEVGGFKIPKDTVIVPQISSVLLDDKIFPDPYKFDPTRHLDSNGAFVKIEEVIPFSLGKRVCLGESLARAELFLFLANIFNTFKFAPVDPQHPPTDKKTMGGTMKARNYQIKLIARF